MYYINYFLSYPNQTLFLEKSWGIKLNIFFALIHKNKKFKLFLAINAKTSTFFEFIEKIKLFNQFYN